MAAGCDYANARVRAMRGRFLGLTGIADLLAQPDLATRLEFLKRTDYGEAVAQQLGRESDPLAAAERGIRVRLMDDLVRIDRFLQGERHQSLFRALLSIEDAWILKTILRGVAAGEAPERIFLLLAPTPEFDPAALGELVRQRNVKAVVDLLATWHSSYALPFEKALPAYVVQRELLHLEVALDCFVFGRVLEAARRHGGEDGRIVRRFLEAQIDLVNAATLLKHSGHTGAEEFYIPGGRTLRPRRFRRYASLEASALRDALGREGRLFVVPGLVKLAALENPFAADQLLHRALREAIRREARHHPLSLAVCVAFVFDRQAEIRRIRLVLRGTEFGLPADELLELVET